ncbi:MAG: hypothetical protein Q4B14_00485 [Clostridia bacterium]|nr:hypothetical protein [Clostridia bacterium]
METKTENTAAESATLRQDKQDKYATENMMLYRTSLALLKSLTEEDTFTEKEYRKICTILTKKYGLSSGSIFAESA